MSESKVCVFPSCTRSKIRRNATGQLRAWCTYHYKGGGKPERLQYTELMLKGTIDA